MPRFNRLLITGAAGNLGGHLRKELGDILLHVVFHSVMAAETGAFTVEDGVLDIHLAEDP